MRRSLYDLLGVRPDDDAESLRKAFRKAAWESHPDRHGDDPEAAARFRQVAEAYDILRDAEQRAAYDRLLEVQRKPLRSKLKSALFSVKPHLVTDAIIGVILTIVLGIVPLNRICVTPKASLGFHEAYYDQNFTFGMKVTSYAGTADLVSYYPSSVKDWIASHQIAAAAWYVASPNMTVAEARRLERVGSAVEEFLDKLQ